MKTKGVQTVLLAMPSLSQARRAEIVAKLQKQNVAIKTTPSLSEIISGKANLTDIHNLSIEDLMSRPTVQVKEDLAGSCVEGKSILVTGAGGSIGSELCRQIVRRKPKTVVLFEMTESALFYIEQELLDRTKGFNSPVEIVAVLGSILDSNRVKETLLKHDVKSVFHAAAYKHVPMLESNPIEGVWNNVIGTKRVTEASSWAGVESLVFVSTDKAVRPTNLMGASKRFAELIVQALTSTNKSMKTCMVRFGNVLGSSGSVVPTFQEQIRFGGPVTVTHPNMTRYFMTIPEASQLVLQAGAMANDAEVFVLDMGESIKIHDLAKRMIELSGFHVRDGNNPNGEIEIKFTGLRPGEKMYEELSIDDCLEKTKHPKITRSIERQQSPEQVLQTATALESAIENRDTEEVLRLLSLAVPEYVQSSEISNKSPLPEVVVPQGELESEPNTASVVHE
jgi:FlaA1/EpsC-like NDP-sugar epimerase